MRVQVVGATAAAVRLARAAASVPGEVQKAAVDAGHKIERDWESNIPRRSGFTASDPQNVTTAEVSPGMVGATVESRHFVARFLQFGTTTMSPRVDLFGLARPHVDAWNRDIGRIVDDL